MFLLNLFVLFDAVALLELIYASTAVYQLLTAGVKRMALGANFNLELALNGAALEGLTACAADDALTVRRMDVLFHSFLLILSAVDPCPRTENSRQCNSIADVELLYFASGMNCKQNF